jgi:anti-sigma B factor antagonist
MATVDFRIKNLKAADSTRATLAEITGSIDATSIVQFQNVMDKLVQKGVKNLILDCANVKYINSTGLGTLLKYVDTFESRDGHIAFTKVPSKVMLVMEMLGFNALFTIMPDEAAALRHFSGKPAAPPAVAEPTPQMAMPTVAPAPTVMPAPTIVPPVAAGPTYQPPAAPAPYVAPAPAQVVAVLQASGYPAAVECTRCHLTLDIPAAGKCRCPRCETVLHADPSGRIQFLAPKRLMPVSISLPAASKLIDEVRGLIEGLAKEMGFAGATAGELGAAVVTASKSVAQLAYGSSDAASSLHVVVIPNANAITVRISDYGQAIPADADGTPEDPSFKPVARAVDSMMLKPNPRGGNLLTMTKRSGA